MTTTAAPLPIASPWLRPNRVPARATRSDRVLAGLVAAGALGVLVIAAMLTPSQSGFGTHEQMGMTACTWAAAFDKPCPTCGMTTAFAHAAEGDLLASFSAQPFGALLAIVTAATFWGALHVAATGSQLGLLAGRLLGARSLWIAGFLGLAAWGYKLMTWPGFNG